MVFLKRFRERLATGRDARSTATSQPLNTTDPVSEAASSAPSDPATPQEVPVKDQDKKPDQITDPAKDSKETTATSASSDSRQEPVVATIGPATFDQLDGLIPADMKGRDAFISACLREKLTCTQASSKALAQVMKENSELAARNADLSKVTTAAAGSTAPLKIGSAPADASLVGNGGGQGVMTHEAKQRLKGPGAAAFYDKAHEIAAARKCTLDVAINAVQTEHPSLLSAYQAECTAPRRK